MEPRWLVFARTLIGTREIPGVANNPLILSWAARIRGWISRYYKADSIPWCGLFVAYVLNQSGLPTKGDRSLTALAWFDYGVKMLRGCPGAIMVFERAGGGHVGFYVGEDTSHYHILGGNQGDAVSIVRVEKSRCVGIRWPLGSGESPGFPVILSVDREVSINES